MSKHTHTPKPQQVADRSDKIVMSESALICLYAGPSSFIIQQDAPFIPLIQMGGGFSYDEGLKAYRFTLQRPLAEFRGTFIEKLKSIERMSGGTLGIGLVFNGMPGGPDDAELRGLWLGNCRDLHRGMSFNSGGPIIDVVAGTCDEPCPWTSFPAKLTGDPEF